MSHLVLQPNVEAAALLLKREELAAVRTRLAECEAEAAQQRAELRTFELRYFREVGVLYAELDELEAVIAEREAGIDGSDEAKARAVDARRQATESQEAAFGFDNEEAPSETMPNLKALFREVARRIHPDFARDDAEQRYFTVLMARANEAYRGGDGEVLQRLLDDHLEINAAMDGETAAAEALRVARQIRHAERDIANLEVEAMMLQSGEVAQLRADVEAAATGHRDLLAELAMSVRKKIADAKHRLVELDVAVPVRG